MIRDYAVKNLMKKLEDIIKPFKMEAVREALLEIGIQKMTILQVKGYGRQKGQNEIYRGSEYVVDFIPKIKIELYLKDEDVEEVIATVVEAAQTTKIGDGKIFIQPIDSAVGIRTGYTGDLIV